MPGILWMSEHFKIFCPVQIKDNFTITIKSAYRANMLICVCLMVVDWFSSLLLWGLHFIFWWYRPGNDHHWYLPRFINVIFMILQEIIRIGFVFFIFILWNFKLNSDMVGRSEIAQRRNVLQINSPQKPYLTWIKINVALCSLFISIMYKIHCWTLKNWMLSNVLVLPLESIQLTHHPEGKLGESRGDRKTFSLIYLF